jgi:hypothetical protein
VELAGWVWSALSYRLIPFFSAIPISSGKCFGVAVNRSSVLQDVGHDETCVGGFFAVFRHRDKSSAPPRVMRRLARLQRTNLQATIRPSRLRYGSMHLIYKLLVVTLGRFELPTCGLGNRRSIHLSYRATRRIGFCCFSLLQQGLRGRRCRCPFVAQLWNRETKLLHCCNCIGRRCLDVIGCLLASTHVDLR